MKFPLVPAYYFSDIYAIDLARLRARGVKLLLADLDNTLVPYGVAEPNHQVRAWKAALEAAGSTLFILSVSRRPGHAGNPTRGGSQRARARMGVTPEETAIVGDQIFTDTWGGNNAGVLTLLVHPIRFGTVFRFLRFALETPFRAGAQKGETL